MYCMESDDLGNFITVSCKHCSKDVRVECRDQKEVLSWNEDLKEGIGAGVYIQCETVCTECEEEIREAEEYYENLYDAGYQFLQLREEDCNG
ncbi:hypothetical protein [Paenibacillus melissococcoides]|uniref:hypothetical protein n=1 Tax=Paenibacillus melissococcoides TaxID=2912268 RepID=UPI0038B237DB